MIPFCAAHLLSYLADESFTYFEKPYGKFAELAEPVSVQEKRFRGNLYILIDGGCFSTSGQFCSLLKFHKIGQLIGSEPGGAHIFSVPLVTTHHPSNRRAIQNTNGEPEFLFEPEWHGNPD